MYHSGKNPLHKVTAASESVYIPKGLKQRRLHKAFLRYHDPANWPMLRAALHRMGRGDLIGSGKHQLIPAWQPAGTAHHQEGARGKGKRFRTQHTGLPKLGSESKTPTPISRKPRHTKGRPHAHINPGSPTGAGKRRRP
jgi:hypothetical protein